MEIISEFAWLTFFLIGLGTLFLIGEVLVNMRGLFALVGILLMTAYFQSQAPSLMLMLIMLAFYFIGLLLIIIDGKLVNDGTLSTIGILGMLASVAFVAPDNITRLYAIAGVLVGSILSLLLLKIFKPRPMWGKIALHDQLTKEAGYTTLNETYEALLGKEGMTETDLRPSGFVVIEGVSYSVVSTGNWIAKETQVKVVEVDGTKIQVEKL